jgi:MHS family shikimate/dehydroshikimate transporter-like MFS transporter
MSNSNAMDSMAIQGRKIELRRVLLSSYVGSAIEYYDYLLYIAAASLIFGQLFFSELTPAMATVASLGTLAVGYVSRPLGAAFFGHFGDKYGRKSVLVTTLLMMGLSTALIGFLPTSAQVGMWSPALLILLRLIQGISVGGEWGGAALMAFEHAPENRRGLASSFSAAGGPTGTMLAALVLGLFALFPERQFLSWGWRIPFLFSFLLVGVGLWMRLRVAESPLFLEEQRKRSMHGYVQKAPLIELLRAPGSLLVSFVALLAPFTFNSLLGSFGLTYAKSSGMSISSILAIQAVGALLCALSEILCGLLSDIYGRRLVMLFGMVVGMLFTYPFLQLLSSGSVIQTTVAFLVMYAFVIAPMFGPCAAYLSEQFDTGSRYTGASLGYQAASTLGGGFVPIILGSLLVAQNGGYGLILLFVVGICVMSSFAVALTVLLARQALPNGSAAGTAIRTPRKPTVH